MEPAPLFPGAVSVGMPCKMQPIGLPVNVAMREKQHPESIAFVNSHETPPYPTLNPI